MVGLGALTRTEVRGNNVLNLFFGVLGLLKLLHISTQIPEQCEYEVTAETRQHLALCLTRLWDDTVFDTRRTVYREKVDLIFK